MVEQKEVIVLYLHSEAIEIDLCAATARYHVVDFDGLAAYFANSHSTKFASNVR